MDKYSPQQLENDDSSSSVDFEKEAFLNSRYIKQEQKQRRRMAWLTFFNLFLFTMSILTLICAVYSQRATSIHAAAKLMEEFEIFSPAMHVVEYEHVKFELPSPINSSKYVGTTNEVENAWMDITYLPDQLVSMEDFPKLKKTVDSIKVTNPKTGETGYRVGLGVFHQLHCLNILRMATYPNYPTKLSWSESHGTPEEVRTHLDDCIEVLRMNLMCLSDVNALTYHTLPDNKEPQPDYESHHVCRNFNKIKDWAKDNAMPSIAA